MKKIYKSPSILEFTGLIPVPGEGEDVGPGSAMGGDYTDPGKMQSFFEDNPNATMEDYMLVQEDESFAVTPGEEQSY